MPTTTLPTESTSLPCRHRRHTTCEHDECSCLCHVLAPAAAGELEEVAA